MESLPTRKLFNKSQNVIWVSGECAEGKINSQDFGGRIPATRTWHFWIPNWEAHEGFAVEFDVSYAEDGVNELVTCYGYESKFMVEWSVARCSSQNQLKSFCRSLQWT